MTNGEGLPIPAVLAKGIGGVGVSPVPQLRNAAHGVPSWAELLTPETPHGISHMESVI